MTDQPVILFDGVCNLCNASVQFVIKHDPAGRFKFAPLQSAVGAQLLKDRSLSGAALDSVILIEDGILFTESDAALQIVRRLNGSWSLLYGLISVPRPLRNLVYGLIARNRYRWFGKQESCMLPTKELRERFLEIGRLGD